MIEKLQKTFPNLEFFKNFDLSKVSFIGIGGTAEIFVNISDPKDFKQVVSFCLNQKIPVRVMGLASNILIADLFFKGLTIRFLTNDTRFIKILGPSDIKPKFSKNQSFWQNLEKKEFNTYLKEVNDFYIVKVPAGITTSILYNFLINKGFVGFEFFSTIPSTIGGAVYNNIHGLNLLFNDFVYKVDVIDKNAKFKTLMNKDLESLYDYSIFHKTHDFIVEVYLLVPFAKDLVDLSKQNQKKALELKKHFPKQRSLGCVFKNIKDTDKNRLNLPTTSTGFLIDKVLNMKGFKINDALVSNEHANFIVNLGKASALDYYTVAEKIRKKALEKNINLEYEIVFWGDFKNEKNSNR